MKKTIAESARSIISVIFLALMVCGLIGATCGVIISTLNSFAL